MSNKSESENNTSACANCGKGEEASGSLKTCVACKMVKYCNRECQVAHRPQHKKECKKRAVELHDEKLFKQPPPMEDCPICFLRLPLISTARIYMACCGKIVCCGCTHAPVYDNEGNVIREKTCPFCRTLFATSDEEIIKRYKKRRSKLNDPRAMYNLGCMYREGEDGLPQNYAKAMELFHRAAELGDTDAYSWIGNACVEKDMKKAVHYWELGALSGDAMARFNLGLVEKRAGDMNRALKHLMIATRDGDSDSLENIKGMYMFGHATKDEYTKALRYYQAYLDEIKSPQRDEAAACSDEYKYYKSVF